MTKAHLHLHLHLPVFAVLTFTLAAEAAPTCQQRVEALKSLSAQLKKEREAADKGPVVTSFRALADVQSRPDWKTRGVRVVATKDAELLDADEAANAGALRELASAGKVEICVEQNAPVEQRLSRDADPKLVGPLLAEIAPMAAMDRATIVASHAEEPAWKCKDTAATFEAVVHVAPADRLAILAEGVAESLEGCKCPAAEAERAFALLSLMADVWADKQACTALVLDKSGKAKPLAVKGPVTALVSALQAAGEKGVVLPGGAPAKPKKKK